MGPPQTESSSSDPIVRTEAVKYAPPGAGLGSTARATTNVPLVATESRKVRTRGDTEGGEVCTGRGRLTVCSRYTLLEY